MVGFEHWMMIVRREIERTVNKMVKRPKMGLVTNYDPKKHAVKVRLQPEGTLTNWIPLTAMAIGNQFGVLYAPNIKDQVEVHFDNGDQMSARVMTRHFSKMDKSPELQAGEYAHIHSTGSQIKHSKDGTIRIAGAGDVTTGPSGQGQSGNSGTGNESQSGGDNTQQTQQQQTQQQAQNSIQINPDGTIVILTKKSDITIEADTSNIFLVTKQAGKQTKAVSATSATVLPVMLQGGGVAKTLYAEPA